MCSWSEEEPEPFAHSLVKQVKQKVCVYLDSVFISSGATWTLKLLVILTGKVFSTKLSKANFLFEIRKIAVCFLWLSLPGHYRVIDEALLAETT